LTSKQRIDLPYDICIWQEQRPFHSEFAGFPECRAFLAWRRAPKRFNAHKLKIRATHPTVGIKNGNLARAVNKGRRYRYYMSTALIREAGTDRAQGWRLPAQEIEDAVTSVLADVLTSPARLLERFGTAGIPSDQTRKILDRATPRAALLNRSPAGRAKVVRDLIEKVVIQENAITMRVRRSCKADNPSTSPPRVLPKSICRSAGPTSAASWRAEARASTEVFRPGLGSSR
jgi:hypothetical protein